MRDNMKNKEIVSRYVDGEVTSDEKILVEQWLKEDKELQAYYQELKALDNLLNEQTSETCSPDWEQNTITSLDALDHKENKTMKKQTLFKTTVGGGVLITLLIAVIMTGQIYSRRGVQGRFKSASDDIGAQFSPAPTSNKTVTVALGGKVQPQAQFNEYWGEDTPVVQVAREVTQYEPYYLKSNIQNDYGGTRSVSSEQQFAYAEFDRDDTSLVVEEKKQEGHLYNTEEYGRIYENDFTTVRDNPLSTFSIDVDTGAYSNVRRFLNAGQLPPADAVRIEEMINYFSYNYEKPNDQDPFSINIDAAQAPWNTAHQLVRIGLQGKTLASEEIPASNLVFLIDVSGSMNQNNKLPLLKKALKMMVRQLSADQRVAIVVYAGAAGQVLESTSGANKQKIISALDRLSAGGSTAGGAGIKLAYDIAAQNYIEGGNNRVIMATDGDFNTGVSSTSEMIRLIEQKRDEGVFITVCGFGMGNYKDQRLEQIANKGNGTYYYIDTEKEANKVFVEELGSTLFTIAKDVKLQIEFNPAQVKAYRLIGYENRRLNKEDFNDDQKDAGELGAGHTVTALYEIIPADSQEIVSSVDELVYQKNQPVASDDVMTVKLRYKEPDQNTSKLIQRSIAQTELTVTPKDDFEFCAAVAEFGLLLRQSQHKGHANYNHVVQAATTAKGRDISGYRQEFIDLVYRAQALDHRIEVEPYVYDVPAGGMRFKNQE